VTGADVSVGSGRRVDVHPPTGRPYRDVSLFLQDDDAGIGTHRMPYGKAVSGVTGLNYQVGVEGRASTPLLEAAAGDLVRVNLLAP
jgi:hypothetical protein